MKCLQVLREKLGVKTVLGLTATATKTTCSSIVRHLNIPDGEKGVIKDVPLPNNLVLSVSRDKLRDRALISLLQGKRFMSCQSIIIYCTRRDECERLASLIRTCLQVWHNFLKLTGVGLLMSSPFQDIAICKDKGHSHAPLHVKPIKSTTIFCSCNPSCTKRSISFSMAM